ncbi:DUF1501 domain-containing protein, partial [Stieleria sp.]|uniref:DUF1501 domain-containing protein n=1 Tax=Stieleria sp. TaxID=2795976 RepID=UPI003568FC89
MKPFTRRDVLAAGAATAGGLGLSSLGLANPSSQDAAAKLLRGKTEHVISIWLGGGMGQIDTFDPKRKGDAPKNQAGSYYESIDTAVEGVRVCEHLSQLAPLMDRVTAVRSVHHEMI